MQIRQFISVISTAIASRTLSIALLVLFCFSAHAQTYTNVYNGVTYTSSQPYNLNVVYFVPNDVPLDTSYKRRISEMVLWGQNFYRQNMIDNGFGPVSFGLFKEAANPNRIKITLIHGAQPSSAYPYTDANIEKAEVDAYFNANPGQKASEHFILIGAAKDLASMNLPYYGTGKYCYAIDFPKMDLKYMDSTGTDADNFKGWFGGNLHELGHSLNVGHSHQTASENFSPTKGMNLMFFGNGSLGHSPTFINRADCAILRNCQVFATTPGTYYNGNNARLTSLKAYYNNGDLVVAGTFSSSLPVTDINIYQDPFAEPSAGYYRVAWSVSPIGADSFYVRMPVSEISGMANIGVPQLYGIQNYIAYNLQFEFSVKNGEKVFSHFPFSYNNNIPNIRVDFDDRHCDALCCGWTQTNIGTRSYGPTPGYLCYTGADNNMRVKTFSTLYGTSDAFPFGYANLTGDGTFVARVRNISTNWNDYGGIMLRNGLNNNVTYVSTGVLDARGVYDQFRTSIGGATSGFGVVNATAPIWVKLQRKGTTFSSFYSFDGITWTPHNNYVFDIPFANTIQAGVFASNPTAVADLEVTSLTQCTLPSGGWQVTDIGSVSAPGTACHTAATGNIHMESYSTGFASTSDNVTFMYKPVTGNVNIVARIKKVSSGWNTLGGIMLRNSLNPNSAYVSTSGLDTRCAFDSYRLSDGSNSGYQGSSTNWAWPAYMWVKLSKTGNTITSYYSTDGANWILYHTFTVAMGSNIYAGLVSAGMGQSSDIDQVWINGVMYSQNSVAESTEKTTPIQLLPNPTRGELHVANTVGQNIKGIRVYDLYGRTLLQQNNTSDIIDISQLPAAVYLVEITMESGEMIRRKITKE